MSSNTPPTNDKQPEQKICSMCGGRRWIVADLPEPDGVMRELTGDMLRKSCPACHGTGVVQPDQTGSIKFDDYLAGAYARKPGLKKYVEEAEAKFSAPQTDQTEPCANGIHTSRVGETRCLKCGRDFPPAPQTSEAEEPTAFGKKTTWYKRHPVGVVCGCGSKSGYPITNEWWDKHTGSWHTLKYWLKRKFKR